jgi:hypothetical protein
LVIFYGFGAGKWRDPVDGRHLPKRTLPHLANLLAGQGLCDVLLPSPSTDDLMRAFRVRLEQAVRTVRRRDPDARVVLVLDAIDHAAIEAQARISESFAHLLLQSLAINPIPGVAVVASCRTERSNSACGDACRQFSAAVYGRETTSLVQQIQARPAGPAHCTGAQVATALSRRVIDCRAAIRRTAPGARRPRQARC